MIDRLSLEKIQLYMNTECPVHFFESTTSTNAVAAELATGVQANKNGVAAELAAEVQISETAHSAEKPSSHHGTLVITRHQTAGRGRLGRSFASPDDSGIYMSIILEPADTNPVLITTAAAVAICRAIENVCSANPQIKWVNDIYLNSKKVCGILAESVTDYRTGAITHIILGIGINCNQTAIPPELADIAGAIEGGFSINQLAAEVYNQVMLLADDLHPAKFIDDYRQRSMVLGETVTVYKGGYNPDKPGLPARVLEIDENGGLKVIYSSGERETLTTGEISIRL